MSGDRALRDIETIRRKWDERARGYDEYYKTFRGAAEHHVEWEILQRHLPGEKHARILDAAGGTGRITIPLAKMGYSVVLSDVSSGMIEVARQKILREDLPDNVSTMQCDICSLPFRSGSFDLTLCWGGGVEAIREVARVTKKGGSISMCVPLRYGTAIWRFRQAPEHALELLTAHSDYDTYNGLKYRVVGEEEVRELFDKEGIRVIDIYAYDLWESLSIPESTLASSDWDDKLFKQTTELMLKLAREPSLRGISRHFALYGEKT